VKILRLTRVNFCGEGVETIETQGRDLNVYAQNGVGKTRLASAFSWCLFGKNSLEQPDTGKGAFDLLPIDTDKNSPNFGQRIKEITEASVEMVLAYDGNGIHDGKQVTLKRTFREKWTKKRGAAISEMTGTETAFEIDGVKGLTESRYKSFIASLVPQIGDMKPEKVWEILSNPLAFNKVLPWEQRRGILSEFSGNVPDVAVMSANPELAELPDILKGHSPADAKKIAKASQTEINKKITETEARTKEAKYRVDQYQPPLESFDLEALRKDRTEKQSQLSSLETTGVSEKVKTLREIEGEITDLDNIHRQAIGKQISETQGVLDRKNSEISRWDTGILGAERELQTFRVDQSQLSQRVENLAQQWEEANALEWVSIVDRNCPACGQVLPDDQIVSAQEKALAAFNLSKSQKIEEIETDGTQSKSKLDHVQSEIVRVTKALEDARESLTKAKDARLIALANVEGWETKQSQPSNDPKRHQLADKVIALKEEIEQLKAGAVNPARDKLTAEIKELDSKIATAETAKAATDGWNQDKARITELQAQQKQLGKDFEALERTLYLIGQFDRTKAGILEGKLNGQFELVTFKMFDVLVNGEINEVCETLFEGKPWGSALSRGQQVRAGCDIVRTLQKHYDFYPPCWIDNRESTTEIPTMPCQVISLYVSAADLILRVEGGE
jgi:hypothetical protein